MEHDLESSPKSIVIILSPPVTCLSSSSESSLSCFFSLFSEVFMFVLFIRYYYSFIWLSSLLLALSVNHCVLMPTVVVSRL